VQCCFWKEEPSLRDALLMFQEGGIKDVYVVPNLSAKATSRRR
jgi:sirohydrochlorin ferrochelatase